MPVDPTLENALARAWAHQRQWGARGDEDSLCMLDLLERTERLETNAQPSSNPSQIRSSLVDRIGSTLQAMTGGDPLDTWEDESRAVIRETASWLLEHQAPLAAEWLEREADHG